MVIGNVQDVNNFLKILSSAIQICSQWHILMKFARNCVFFVDSPRNFPRGEENFWANPLKITQFLTQIPLKNKNFWYKNLGL